MTISLNQFKAHVLVEIEQAKADTRLQSMKDVDMFVQEIIDREMRKLSPEQSTHLLCEALFAALAKELS